MSEEAVIEISGDLRLRRFDSICPEAMGWYSDPELVWLVDGVREPYDAAKLERMYSYLNAHGELYYIEALENGSFKPIGDVTFSAADLPIVIGDPAYRGRGVGKAVIRRLIERARELGLREVRVREIYDYNLASRALFEGLGFIEDGKTSLGARYRLVLR